MPSRHMQLYHGSGFLSSELASPLRYILLSSGLPSMGLRSLPLLVSVLLLKVEGGIWP
jgi:hypothetical protein